MRMYNLLISLTMVLAAATSALAIDAKAIYQQSQPSTVTIYNIGSDGNPQGTGTGFYVDEGNYIVTNHHVIDGASEIALRDADGKIERDLWILDINQEWDLAVLVSKRSGPPLRLAGYDPEIGDNIITIGNPLGLDSSLSTGVISGMRQVTDSGAYIQMTAPISPGNSGGPVLDEYGRVLGVSTMHLKDGQNLNFASSTRGLVSILPETAFSRRDEPVNLSHDVGGTLSEDGANEQYGEYEPDPSITDVAFYDVRNKHVGDLIVVSGIYTNLSGETERGVSLTMRYFDSSGALISSHSFAAGAILSPFQIEEMQFNSIQTRLSPMQGKRVGMNESVPFMTVIKAPGPAVDSVEIIRD